MVTWADADAAVEAERAVRIKRVENATLVSALTLLLCAVWLAWPSIRGLSNGDGVVLASFGAPLLVLIWGIFVQDLTLDDGAARSRVASATSIAWPLLMCLGALGFEGDVPAMAGSGLVLLSGVMCRQLSHRTMRGNFGVLRYRAILTGIGTLSALALTLTAHGANVTETDDLLGSIASADVVYMTRIQKERFADEDEYTKVAGAYKLHASNLEGAKENMIIMHPLPRVDEIHPSVDATRHARYFEQAFNGVVARMALLCRLLNIEVPATIGGDA